MGAFVYYFLCKGKKKNEEKPLHGSHQLLLPLGLSLDECVFLLQTSAALL